MSVSQCQLQSQATASHPTLGRRILRMSVVWAALGAVVGTSAGMEGGGLIGAVAGMMAGIVEFAMLGAIFAVVGGRPDESVLGAVGGLLVGLASCAISIRAPVVLVANFGLVFGAMVGATLRAYLRLLSLPVVFLGRLLLRDQRLSTLAFRHVGRIEHRPFLTALHPHAPENRTEGVRSPLPHGLVGSPRADGIYSDV
jgi:hypothetical protein